MKSIKKQAENVASWIYEQEKKQARKQERMLRSQKQGRKSMWLCAAE